jgi:hypothetical protein
VKRRLIALFLAGAIASGCSTAPAAAPSAAPDAPAPTSAPAAPAAKPAESTKAADTGKIAEAPKPAEVAKPTEPARPAAAAPADPKTALTQAFRGWGGTKSFRAKINTTGLQGGDSEMKMDVVMPDRIHMTRTGGGMEMIMVGDSAWMKLPNGWQKFGSGFDVDLTNPKKFEESIGASTETKLIGPDLLDGTPCLVYQYTTTLVPETAPAGGAPAGAAAKPGIKPGPVSNVFTAKVWVGVADQLPRKLESADPNSPTKTTILYYDFNAPITVNPPA